jgi:hypothetical protein
MTMTLEACIEGTETTPPAQALNPLQQVHQCLTAALRPKVALLTQLDLGPQAREGVQAALAQFCDGPLRDYLDTCDQRLYVSASGEPETRLLILALRTNAAVLRRHLDALPNADEAPTVTSLAESIDALLAAHLAIERTALLPALPAHAAAEVLALVADLEARLGCQVAAPAA